MENLNFDQAPLSPEEVQEQSDLYDLRYQQVGQIMVMGDVRRAVGSRATMGPLEEFKEVCDGFSVHALPPVMMQSLLRYWTVILSHQTARAGGKLKRSKEGRGL